MEYPALKEEAGKAVGTPIGAEAVNVAKRQKNTI